MEGCGLAFVEMDALKDHVKEDHKPPIPTSECPVCHRTVPTDVIGVHHKEMGKYRGNSCAPSSCTLRSPRARAADKSCRLQIANIATLRCSVEQMPTTHELASTFREQVGVQCLGVFFHVTWSLPTFKISARELVPHMPVGDSCRGGTVMVLRAIGEQHPSLLFASRSACEQLVVRAISHAWIRQKVMLVPW